MTTWASKLHYRLYLQGHDGRARQRIIDDAMDWLGTGMMVGAIDLGLYLATEDKVQLDCLEIKMEPLPWYIELWQTVRYVFECWVSWKGW